MNAIISSQASINQDYTLWLWLIFDPKITRNLPLNFCARVWSVDDILLIASRVFLSIACREWRASFCSIVGLQHDPAVDTSQYRSLTSEKGNEIKESIKAHSWKLQSIKAMSMQFACWCKFSVNAISWDFSCLLFATCEFMNHSNLENKRENSWLNMPPIKNPTA